MIYVRGKVAPALPGLSARLLSRELQVFSNCSLHFPSSCSLGSPARAPQLGQAPINQVLSECSLHPSCLSQACHRAKQALKICLSLMIQGSARHTDRPRIGWNTASQRCCCQPRGQMLPEGPHGGASANPLGTSAPYLHGNQASSELGPREAHTNI